MQLSERMKSKKRGVEIHRCVCWWRGLGTCHSTPHGFCGSPEASVVHWGLKHPNHTARVCALVPKPQAAGHPVLMYDNISLRLHTS